MSKQTVRGHVGHRQSTSSWPTPKEAKWTAGARKTRASDVFKAQLQTLPTVEDHRVMDESSVLVQQVRLERHD